MRGETLLVCFASFLLVVEAPGDMAFFDCAVIVFSVPFFVVRIPA